MNGLMTKKQEASATPPAEDSAPEAAADPKGRGANPQPPESAEGGEAATPEEEQAMASVLNAALTVIYDDQSHPQILKTLQEGQRPDTALADTAAAIVLQIDEQSGGRVPETVILPAAQAIIGLLAELAEAAGVFEVDDTTLALAAQQATLALLTEYGADPADVQALIQKIGPDQVKAMVSEQQQMAQGWAGERPGFQQPQQAPVPEQPTGA